VDTREAKNLSAIFDAKPNHKLFGLWITGPRLLWHRCERSFAIPRVDRRSQ